MAVRPPLLYVWWRFGRHSFSVRSRAWLQLLLASETLTEKAGPTGTRSGERSETVADAAPTHPRPLTNGGGAAPLPFVSAGGGWVRSSATPTPSEATRRLLPP